VDLLRRPDALVVAAAFALVAIGVTAASGAPGVSGPAGRVLFSSNRDLAGNPFDQSDVFAMNADGTKIVRLTAGGSDGDPRRSPDGKLILFISARDHAATHTPELYVMNADGSGERRLTIDDGSNRSPTWSPDGNRIAWTRWSGSTDIYVADADGSDAQNLTPGPGYDTNPDWSPSGKLVFNHNAVDSAGNEHSDLYVMNADGTGVKHLLATDNDEGDPRWSPNGKRIAFTRCPPASAACDIYLIDASGSGLRRLTDDPATDAGAVWSPDGKRILFHSERNGSRWDIFVMNADGSDERLLLGGPANDFATDWVATSVTGGCTLTGTGRSDTLVGTAKRDVICGLGGNDTLKGWKGNDVLKGGPGNDILVGGAGNDVLDGASGNDRGNGGPGNDRCKTERRYLCERR
jgi:TolB protein